MEGYTLEYHLKISTQSRVNDFSLYKHMSKEGMTDLTNDMFAKKRKNKEGLLCKLKINCAIFCFRFISQIVYAQKSKDKPNKTTIITIQ